MTGDSHWVFESSEPGTRELNKTDGRFFWLAVYVQPGLWVVLAVVALVRFGNPIWLSLVGACPWLSISVLGREGKRIGR